MGSVSEGGGEGTENAPYCKPVHILRPKRPIRAVVHLDMFHNNRNSLHNVEQARSIFAVYKIAKRANVPPRSARAEKPPSAAGGDGYVDWSNKL